jgi:hypothetical protein
MIQNREVEVSTLVLDGTIGSGAIPENGNLSSGVGCNSNYTGLLQTVER